MILVDIHNAQSLLEIDERLLDEITRTTLEAEGVTSAEISIAILDDPAIHKLNREFLDHDYPTDVLSFLLDESTGPKRRIEGEVIISAEYATRSSEDFDWRPHDELVLYLVHGLLHLAGYDDQTPEDRTVMRSREQDILSRWKLQPVYHAQNGHSSTTGDTL